MSKDRFFKFRLYVADGALNSTLALANLTAICREHLQKRHTIEIVDVYLHPQRAMADSIFMTPTLIKLAPSPVRRIVGNLNQTQSVVLALGLDTIPT